MIPILRFFTVVLTFACLFLPSQVSAQSLLQNTGGTLQPQSNQTQSTNNSQNQTGSPQSSGNQSALNQQNNQPLGVVSSPQQSNPDTVAQPSSELRASSTLQDSTLSTPVKFLLGFLAVFLIVFFVAYRFSRLDFEEVGSFNESQTAADLGSQRRIKTKKLKKKKRRKPHQR